MTAALPLTVPADLTVGVLRDLLVGGPGTGSVSLLADLLVDSTGVAMIGPLEDLVGAAADFLEWARTVFEGSVRHARGPLGLGIIALYSFLIAFILPLPSEVVLVPAGQMRLGLPYSATMALIVLVSGLGKAAGSLLAFHIGQEAKEYGPLIRRIKASRFDIVEWSERKTVQLAREYGYVGLALALSVPFFPDTISIYAFTILERDYVRFAAATFAGSVGRLLVTLAFAGGAIALF